MANLKNAIDALVTAKEVAREIRNTLEDVVAIKKLAGKSIKRDQKVRRRAARRITHCTTVHAHLLASQTVVSAPTSEEISIVRKLVNEVRTLAIEDAMTRAGLKALSDALDEAGNLSNKVKKSKP